MLVKRYHPDRQSADASHEQIALINQAYDILTDPEKRARYDRGFTAFYIEPEVEDPVEVYKREFKRKRQEQDRREWERKRDRKNTIYKVMRWIHLPILIFGVWLILRDLLVDHEIKFWHTTMTLSAAYIWYRKDRTDFAYGLAQFIIMIFIATLLVTFP